MDLDKGQELPPKGSLVEWEKNEVVPYGSMLMLKERAVGE